MEIINDDGLKRVYAGNELVSAEVAEQVIAIVAGLCRVDGVNGNTTFEAIGVDSMDIAEIVAMVEDVFHVNLHDYQQRGLKKVDDLFAMLASSLNGRGH